MAVQENEQLLKRRLKRQLELSEVRPRVREEWARLMLLGFAREPLHIQWSLSAIRGDTGHTEHFVGGFTDLVFTIQQVPPIKRLLFIIHANTDLVITSPQFLITALQAGRTKHESALHPR